MVIATNQLNQNNNKTRTTKRLSFIDKGKYWAKQFIIKKSPQNCLSSLSNDFILNDTNLLTYKSIKSSQSTSTLLTSNKESPLDENGYLIPIQIIQDIIHSSNTNLKNENSQSQSSLKQQNFVILSPASITTTTTKQTPPFVHVLTNTNLFTQHEKELKTSNKFDDIRKNLIDYIDDNSKIKKFNHNSIVKDLNFTINKKEQEEQEEEPLIYIDSNTTELLNTNILNMNTNLKRKNILNLIDNNDFFDCSSNETSLSNSSDSFDFSSSHIITNTTSNSSSNRSSSNVSDSISDMMKFSRTLMTNSYEKSWENSLINNFVNKCNLIPPQIPAPQLPKRRCEDTKHLLAFNGPQKDTDSINSFSNNSFNSENESIEDIDDLNEAWYQPNISREDVYDILQMLDIGSFLIRFSNSCKNCFALSIRVPYFANTSGVAHYLIIRNQNGYKLKGVDKEFKTLRSLVTHYSVMQEILPVTLNIYSSTTHNYYMTTNTTTLTKNKILS